MDVKDSEEEILPKYRTWGVYVVCILPKEEMVKYVDLHYLICSG